MFEKLTTELVDGRKTYSVSGFAFISNICSKIHIPDTVPEWTELFNMWAAIGACILILWRLVNKFRNRKKDDSKK